ncbi:ABC transporter C family member 10-like isoform X2 [Durio zibethinus]|uniref:ABC-type xenobiotic transporter n=1 Tax=Durio zibethinus TaxID=66656 RepID=A0A6P5YBJ8_DURZI|nr:ABC transporter C family member 10-like isoform X2 [Durio zibethinus]
MEDLWTMFCRESTCTETDGKTCNSTFWHFTHPSSCIQQAMIICFNILLLVMLLFNMIQKSSSKTVGIPARFRNRSALQMASAIVNGFLGLGYLCFGIWVLEENLRKTQTVLPLNWWLLALFQGCTWLLVGLTVSLRGNQLPKTPLGLLSILAFIFAAVVCILSTFAILSEIVTVKIVLDALSLPGAILLLLCAYKGYKHGDGNHNTNESGLYDPLNGEANDSTKADYTAQVTPFATAGCFSKFSFWWLNPLMKKGREKTLLNEDIPKLREAERAGSSYLLFLEQSNKQKQAKPSSQPSILKTIILCHWRDIFVSGFFALLKIITMSSGPLLLNAFILVAEGKGSFKYEGYLLAMSLFFAKSLESLSQRQWYFRTRLIGLNVRSLLTAAIYKKQLRLSNAARLMHSSGEITNYVTVDAYRIGEFPFWFHQTWTTSLQLCIALVILFRAVGLATIAALVVIFLTVLCNTPLAKLQHRFQSKLMVAQDERLKASSEALINMKVLKLYAWESHFKKVIENLRAVEYKWLSAVQLRRAYNAFLLWSSPVLVSAATFGACYFLKIPLHASNVFTFVATLRLVQDPIRSIPDVIGIVIQAKVAFARVVNFFEAPELQSTNVRQKHHMENADLAISIKSGGFSWEENSSKPTLRNITLEVRMGEKVAVCGEVGSGKSTLLAAILGEVPNVQGSEYVMEALSGKAVLLVTHQVDFLPAFDSVLLMSDGEILQAASYHHLLASSEEFQGLVNAHKETAGSGRVAKARSSGSNGTSTREIKKSYVENQFKESKGDQLIKQEERERGDTGFKPYIQYLNQNKGFLFFFISAFTHLLFVGGQISQNSWMAASVDNPSVSPLKLIGVYLVIGFFSTLLLLCRSLSTVTLGIRSSKSLFSQLINSLFRAPMTFYDSTPLGRILSRASSDLSIVDLDIPFNLILSVVATINAYSNLGVLAVVTWQVLFVSIPIIYAAIRLQKYYFSTAKELMRINGTTKSLVANHLGESIAGAITVRAFEEEERFFVKILDLIDTNASPFFHSFSANEWLIHRLETFSATVLASAALCMVLLPPGTFSSGFIGMALSYGLSLNMSLVFSIKNQCTIANNIISVERLNQYMYIPSEAPEVIEGNRPPSNWPAAGKVDICDLQIRYRAGAPLVLRGISCTFQEGHKIGIVGRTGSGKTTLISALFHLVEPAGGKIVVDGIDISTIGLHDLRSRFGIIPQDPTLFNGIVRYNLDPLSQHTDLEIWEVLDKCQLQEAVQEKEKGLDSLVVQDGSNWSMGQRQLFCLGRALLRRSRILVLDEATASIDNATDLILQKTIRTEFADCTVITVAHRIPTVMDCTMVLAISDGKLVEYDEPTKLMEREGSLFGQLVKEYWSHYHSAEPH